MQDTGYELRSPDIICDFSSPPFSVDNHNTVVVLIT
jgi:hypothetical protein